MLQRALVHLSLILLFSFTQMGVATHAISHLADGHEQHQQDQDQSNTENQCGQCLSLSHAADANLAETFILKLAPSRHTHLASTSPSLASLATLSYSARAPPLASQA